MTAPKFCAGDYVFFFRKYQMHEAKIIYVDTKGGTPYKYLLKLSNGDTDFLSEGELACKSGRKGDWI